MSFRIEYGGLSKSPESWGVTVANLLLINQDTDTLTLSTSAQAIAEPIFAYGQPVVLWRDGTRIFQGTVTQIPAQGNAGTEGTDYLVSGGWWALERIIFLQNRLTWGYLDFPSNDPVQSLTSRAMLGMGASILDPIDAAAQITAAVQYAITAAGLNLAIGTITVPIRPPYQETRDLSVAEVVRRTLAWTPDAVVRFDYSPAVPTFNVALRSALTPVSLDLSAANRVAEVSANPRHDLVPSGVFFIFEKPITVLLGGVLVQRVTITSQSAGGTSPLGRVVKTFQLAGAAFGEGVGEPEPVFFAANFYASVSTLHYQGSLLLLEEEVEQTITLGQVINLTNGLTAWGSMNALVQEVEYDFAKGSTRVNFGPPTQLGPQEFLTLLLEGRKGNGSDFALTRDDGRPPGPPVPPVRLPDPPPLPPPTGPQPPPSGFEPTAIELQVCDPEGTVIVMGYRK